MELRNPGRLLGLVVLVLMAGFVVKQNTDRRHAAAWPTAPGSIVSARLDDSRYRRHDQVGDTHFVRSEVRYTIALTYDYEVGGQHFTGSRLGFDTGTRSLDSARRELARFDKGTPVTVHYNPADPAESMVLE